MASQSLARQIVEAPPETFWLTGGVVILVTVIAYWAAFSTLWRKRVIQNTATSLIRSASQGFVELQGEAVMMGGDPVHAPLSLRPCVWFRYKVERVDREAEGKRNWRVVDKGVSDAIFYLVDASGSCAVDPDGAKVTPSHRQVWYGNSRVAPPPRDESAIGQLVGIGAMGRKFRYTEERIESGDPLYGLGHFTTHGGAGVAFDQQAEIRERLREWKQDRDALLARFDSNGDGEIDLEEWDRAQAAAETEVAAERERIAAAPPVDVLGRTADKRHPFVLAGRTEDQILAHYNWGAGGFFAVALTLSSALTWALTLRF